MLLLSEAPLPLQLLAFLRLRIYSNTSSSSMTSTSDSVTFSAASVITFPPAKTTFEMSTSCMYFSFVQFHYASFFIHHCCCLQLRYVSCFRLSFPCDVTSLPQFDHASFVHFQQVSGRLHRISVKRLLAQTCYKFIYYRITTFCLQNVHFTEAFTGENNTSDTAC